ncbi:valine--tRNA ligase [Candidatus Pelagisphaera phototrophica]|uniref:valine--tRNA ligase n=1 Tax=Candidatus Pelagisphaera phototrophica TaxID=2684113 RepID=UPI0019E2AD88|nr:valine--tRNA ligase [Candidatus Pelagisphaera phototrophica]QXD33273.1 valine--tRNA ligase [Candidatus Pelagisphaera phototrophica]
MSAELNQNYDPKEVESKWYKAWEKKGSFEGNVQNGKDSFAIMIPPPNVTGILHMGHVLDNTLQDIFIRRARVEGKSSLWFPGTDHASIATQHKVEKALRDEGTSRYELGREKFLERAWEWSDEHGGIIFNQLRKLGASCDWRRSRFTMDTAYQRSVQASFVEFYNRGYIYRGKRLVNWCPASQTALSNEEVEMRPQRGKLYKMRYEIVEEPGRFVEISTTRPETIMGDTGVAVHPNDERYADLVGKHCWRPFPRAEIPVVADRSVEKEFGTGVLKVTPAHDQVDFDIGKRHDLPLIDVMNPDGTLNELAGEEFDGMERFKARKFAVQKLEELGLLIDAEDYDNSVGFSERGGVPIEPRLSEQWYLKYPKVEEAKRAVEKGIIRFHPKRWEKVYLHWLNNIQDWCISRQLWWGQRIPVWYAKGADRSDSANWHVSVDGPSDPENWEQDEDVLDTWASSNLWPFATFGWPIEDQKVKAELDYFYPTSMLVTGFDIIFFWVARMIMSGLELMGESKEGLTDEEIAQRIPFKDIFIHGLIRDAKGRKMSKSLGNSPDPLDLIAKFGADGLRFGIINIAPSGSDILFAEERIEIGRNFCTKLWNACRFRQMAGGAAEGQSLEAIIDRLAGSQLEGYGNWILFRLLQTMEEIEGQFARFEMHQLTHSLHNFLWGDFCDWYVEAAKAMLQSKDDPRHDAALAVSDLVIRQSLLLLHPIMPHITEELWQAMGYSVDGEFLQDAGLLPAAQLRELLNAKSVSIDAEGARQIELIKELITQARATKAEYNVASKRDVTLFVTPTDDSCATLIEANLDTIKRLAGAASIELVEAVENLPGSVSALGTVYLDLSSAVDVEAEKERLSKELEKLTKAIQAGEGKLNNPSFVDKAPPQVVEGVRKQLLETKARRDEIARLLKSL